MDSNKKLRIGERLASVRASKRLSQKDMGERLRISWRTYQNYEVGNREVSVDFVMEFCNAFSIRPEWLVNGSGGKDRVNEVEAFRETLLSVERVATEMGKSLKTEDIADLSARLFRKRIDGFELSDQDFRDYIELKANG